MPASAVLVDPFLPAILEIEARRTRLTKLQVFDNSADAENGSPRFGAPGTILVFVARKGSGALELVRAAVEEGGIAAERLRTEVERQFAGRHPLPLDEAIQMMVREPVFADICYGGETLNKGVFLPPGMDLVFAAFPYNGGRLAPDGFSLVEHYKDGSDAALEAVVVRSEPPLTPAEREALRLVPDDELRQNVGYALDCRTTWWAVAVVVAAVAVTLTLACLVSLPTEEAHLSEEDLEKLGPAASARTLLDMRRTALLQRAPWERAA